MKEISLAEIQFSPSSYSQDGRLFEWQGELYRAITAERSRFFEEILKNGVIQDLVNRGFLIETQPAPITLPGYGLVVQHRKVPFITYAFEWCDQALKDAALFLLDLNLELLRFGLMTHDVHPWNILFEGTNPVFVDLGSIKPVEEIDFQIWVDEFQRFFWRPLYLLADEQRRIARMCLQYWNGWDAGVHYQDFIRLTQQDLSRRLLSRQVERLRKSIPAPLRVPLRPVRRAVSKVLKSRQNTVSPHENVQSRQIIVERLRAELGAVKLPETLDRDYYKEMFTFPSLTDPKDWSPKQRGVAEMMRKVNPGTVVDIGSNRGWYSQLAAHEGASVVTMDVDEPVVSFLYRDVKRSSLSVQPLVIDFVWPSPGTGLLNYRTPAADRLKGEMAMALALVHHLVHLRHMPFDHIIDGLSRFTSHWLLTEFIPYTDPYLSTWTTKQLDWYRLDNFLAALKVKFRVVETMESDPSARTLIFCERAANAG